MNDIAQSIQKAIAERNYSASSHMFDHALRENSIPDLIEALEEMEEAASLLTLELRDHVFYYLGMWDIYFAVQITSLDVLRILREHNVKQDAPTFMIDFIRNLLDTKDSRFSQFCVNIETISGGHYAILVPSILDQRMEELMNCRIQYRDGPRRLYCTAELMDTYYGGKIVTAIHGHSSFDIIISEEQFATIQVGLDSAGFDTSSMLDRIDSVSWDEFVKNKRKPHIERGGSGELSVMHRVKSARSNIYSQNFRQQVAALNAINIAKTQLCNDVLISVALDPTYQMRHRALNQLGESGDSNTLEFLASLMKNDDDAAIRKEAARTYSMLTSRSQLTSITHTIPRVPIKSSFFDISKINKILNTLIAKGMPTVMIDDTLKSLAIQGGPDSVDILTRLLAKHQVSVKSAVIKAS
ncbi:MAG: HEAT repeat domain-containing protein, partial [Candidatus Thorarchaeota archaeon]